MTSPACCSRCWPTGVRLPVALALTAAAVLIPSLLYYGGGWLQYGYRYALDSIPFVIALWAWPWRGAASAGASA